MVPPPYFLSRKFIVQACSFLDPFGVHIGSAVYAPSSEDFLRVNFRMTEVVVVDLIVQHRTCFFVLAGLFDNG